MQNPKTPGKSTKTPTETVVSRAFGLASEKYLNAVPKDRCTSSFARFAKSFLAARSDAFWQRGRRAPRERPGGEFIRVYQ
jgi:hypothetical protein